MYAKTEKNYTYIYSSMSEVPEGIVNENKILSEKLLSLVKLVGQKYRLDDVQVRFDNSASGTVSVLLFNGCHGIKDEETDKENISPIEFLKAFGGKTEKEPYKHAYWSKSVITIDSSKVEGIIEGLKLLTTPSEPSESRMIARC